MSDAELWAFDALLKHPRLADLTGLAQEFLRGVLAARSRDVVGGQMIADHAVQRSLTHDQALTPFRDVIAVLERGPQDDAERALACALYAHALALLPPNDRASQERTALDIVWL